VAALRTRLLWLVCAALAPVAILAVAGLLALDRQQRDQARHALVEKARALASAVDVELQASVAALEVLALAPSLAAGDLRSFHAQARTAAEFRGSWDSVLLTDPSGKWLLSTRIPYGARLPGRGAVVERKSFDLVRTARRPAIGNLAQGPGGRHLFPVRVPMVRDGELRYVLNALVDPASMLRILERQKVPAQSLGTVFDANLNVVARSRGQQLYVGTPLSDSLRALMGSAGEGWGVTRTREGEEAYSAFSRADALAWGVALGVAKRAVDMPLWRSFALSAAGIALCFALGGLAAAWLARRVSRPIAALSEAARAAERGELHAPAPAGIPEVDEVARALADAVRRLHELNATLEARVAERTGELERANLELAASNEELESFSYSVSHDLRAPLRAVDGYAALLLQDAGGLLEPARQRLRTVRDSAQHMGRLIDALLAFSRLSRSPVARARVDVAALARECVAEQRGASTAEVAIGGLPAADADPQLLRQVLANLVGNAFKYSMRTRAPRVEIGALEDGGHTVYYVRDNGVGFDMQHAGKLFGVFQRLHGAEEYEGTGVGLAIVQRIIARHGGRVWAQAAPGAGATLYFTLESA
jgi:signal transduction histidine kinase